MIIWKTIDDSEGQNFPFEHPESESQNEIRKTHYRNSRLALMKAAIELRKSSSEILEVTFDSLKDLEITNHHHLKQQSNILVSIAHTRGLAVAACASKDNKTLGIGIDCESADRTVKESLLDKFSLKEDKANDYLHLWCAKEAAFKASSSFWKSDKTFVLKDITIVNDEFSIPNLGKGHLKFRNEKGHLICVAILEELF